MATIAESGGIIQTNNGKICTSCCPDYPENPTYCVVGLASGAAIGFDECTWNTPGNINPLQLGIYFKGVRHMETDALIPELDDVCYCITVGVGAYSGYNLFVYDEPEGCDNFELTIRLNYIPAGGDPSHSSLRVTGWDDPNSASPYLFVARYGNVFDPSYYAPCAHYLPNQSQGYVQDLIDLGDDPCDYGYGGYAMIFNTYANACNYEDDWSNSITYVIGEMVVHNGSCYVCILGHINHEPPNALYWLEMGVCEEA